MTALNAHQVLKTRFSVHIGLLKEWSTVSRQFCPSNARSRQSRHLGFATIARPKRLAWRSLRRPPLPERDESVYQSQGQTPDADPVLSHALHQSCARA